MNQVFLLWVLGAMFLGVGAGYLSGLLAIEGAVRVNGELSVQRFLPVMNIEPCQILHTQIYL